MTLADVRLIRFLAGKALRLPRARSGRLEVVRGFEIPMRDSVTLLADRYGPSHNSAEPVVLMRCPYGRGSVFGLMAALFAERGFHAVIQSVRGTCGSGGQFDPMRQERKDGYDTLEWIRSQSWCDGRVYTFGVSYLGNAQWAMGMDGAEGIGGQAMGMTLSNFRDELLSFGGFTLEGMLGWTGLMRGMVGSGAYASVDRLERGNLRQAHGHLPLGTIDRAAFGETIPWWQDWVRHADPADPWWQGHDFSAAVGHIHAPVAMIAGWQDIFLPFQLRDYAVRQAAGLPTSLTIGPWTHSAPGGMAETLRQGVETFSSLRDGVAAHPGMQPIRLFLQGARQWLEFPSWPPSRARATRLHLRGDGRLCPEAPGRTPEIVGYVFDPADPTPAVHGPTVMGRGRNRDMRPLEQRSDSIVFTGEPLDAPLDVVGPVSLEVTFRCDREHTDLYACLCDVDGTGRPRHVVDGYVRLYPGAPPTSDGGVRQVTIECWPTAYRFARGHRLRLIICGGAHPRYARNAGTGEPLAKTSTMLPAHQEIVTGGPKGSCLVLSVI